MDTAAVKWSFSQTCKSIPLTEDNLCANDASTVLFWLESVIFAEDCGIEEVTLDVKECLQIYIYRRKPEKQ